MTAYNTITVNDDGDICIVTTTTNEAKTTEPSYENQVTITTHAVEDGFNQSILLNQINLILRVSTVLKRPLPRKHLNLRIRSLMTNQKLQMMMSLLMNLSTNQVMKSLTSQGRTNL